MCLINSADRCFWRENRCRTVDYVPISTDNSWVEFSGGEQNYGGKIPAVYNYNDQSGESSHYQSYHIRKFVAGVILLPVPRKVEAPTFMK